MGIEPTLSVWETDVLPLNYICISVGSLSILKPPTKHTTHTHFQVHMYFTISHHKKQED